jgi:hypothetical protein
MFTTKIALLGNIPPNMNRGCQVGNLINFLAHKERTFLEDFFIQPCTNAKISTFKFCGALQNFFEDDQTATSNPLAGDLFGSE